MQKVADKTEGRDQANIRPRFYYDNDDTLVNQVNALKGSATTTRAKTNSVTLLKSKSNVKFQFLL